MSHKCQCPNPESSITRLRAQRLPIPPDLALAARYSRRLRKLHKAGMGHLEASMWLASERERAKLRGAE